MAFSHQSGIPSPSLTPLNPKGAERMQIPLPGAVCPAMVTRLEARVSRDCNKNLSAESIPMVIKGLGLNAKEATFFTALVQFGQSKDAAEREQFFQKLHKLLKTQRFAGTQHLLAHSQYLIFTQWQHTPITADVAKASVEPPKRKQEAKQGNYPHWFQNALVP